MNIIAFLLGLIIISIITIIFLYNNLIVKKNDVENAFGGMDAQLKKRYDLIPNLVSTLKEYMTHEREVLEQLTQLRARAMGMTDTEQKVNLDNQIASSLGSVMVAVENYPELKASGNFTNLQRTLNEVESQISASRRAYNSAVTSYNNAVETFPSNLIARRIGMGTKPVFEIIEVERQNIDVKSLFTA